MKLKICVAFLFAATLLALEGCSTYEYYEHDYSVDGITAYSAYWPAADSSLREFAADTSHSGLFIYSNYIPQDKSLKRDISKDSTRYKFTVDGSVGLDKDVFSIKLTLYYIMLDPPFYSDNVSIALYVDVYGCSDFACERASKVVVHSDDYGFTRLLSKDEFKISKPEEPFDHSDDGYDCDVVKEYHFHLQIDMDDLKIDLDAQKGSESCYYRNSKWCLYC